MKLMDYYLEFALVLKTQLEHDQERWGDEWKRRPIERVGGITDKGRHAWDHQNERIIARINEYYKEWEDNGISIPWLKVAGLAFIAWVREQYSDTYMEE